MNNPLFQALMTLLRALFGGGQRAPETTNDSATGPAADASQTDDVVLKPGIDDPKHCQLGAVEIPSDQPYDRVPQYTSQAQLDAAQAASGFSAQAAPTTNARNTNAQVANCVATIKPQYGLVAPRMGPGLGYYPTAFLQGGLSLPLVGTSEPDADAYRWFNVQVGPSTAWLRSDLVTLSRDCLIFNSITEADLTPPEPPVTPASERFPPPVNGTLTQGYHSQHRGLDIAVPVGTPISAPTAGTIIRHVVCQTCQERSRPNIFPCGPAIYRDIKWGYGYGNFIIVRHEARLMPPTLRAEMAQRGLSDGFAYVLYAHFSRLDVALGDNVQPGQALGATGNHGCSSGPHLHFEVRIGRDASVENRWLQQAPVDPALMFRV